MPAGRLPVQHAVTGSLCLGLALSNGFRPHLAGLVPALALLMSALALARDAAARLACVLAVLLLVALLVGGLRLRTLDRSVLGSLAGDAARVRLTVTGPVRRSGFSLRAPVRVESYASLRPDERAVLELPPGAAPEQGQILTCVARVLLPRDARDGGFDERRWLARQGVHVVLRADGCRCVGRRGGIGGFGDRLRRRLSHDLAPGLGGEQRALVGGLVLGEDEGLSFELRSAFRVSGTYHLLAVSGSNVAFVVAGTLALVWLAGLSRLAGEAIALVVIALYVLVVGWQPSVVRAAVSGVLSSLAWLAARPRDRWYFLLLGALVLLAWNPASLFDAGFQLSFAAVISIFLAARPLERRLDGYPLPGALRGIVAVSLACSLATAPILLLDFHSLPVYGVLGNALIEPAVAFVLVLALACALVAPIALPAAQALALVEGLLVSYIALAARAVAMLPAAQAGPRAAALLAAGLLLAVALGPRRRRARLLGLLGRPTRHYP
ncbi:MAG: ComEC/Rec2 family competence protein [Gaiellaceae bacterium]